jgi:chemotaxis protein methyltransferase CheR
MQNKPVGEVIPQAVNSGAPGITDAEFAVFKQLIYDWIGIYMAETKKALVSGRLMNRLRHYQLQNFTEYLEIVRGSEYPEERQIVINLLTTNETYFFREMKHFDWLRDRAQKHTRGEKFRVWSAACSSGQEVYSIAMILADTLGTDGWEIYASDVSERIVEKALTATYPIEQARQIPETLLKQFCLKGVNEAAGTLCIHPDLRKPIHFYHLNLIDPLPTSFGLFDVIFLRNVMIYFDRPTRQKVAESLSRLLKPEGCLVVGHAESLHGITDKLKTIRPTIYAVAKN